jgi:hypothetical protein
VSRFARVDTASKHPATPPLRVQNIPRSPDGVAQFAVRKRFELIGDGAVVNERGLVGVASFDVPVERVEAAVELAAGEPAVEGGAGIVEDLVPPLVPVDCVAGIAPERFGILNRTIECVLPGAAARSVLSSLRPRATSAKASAAIRNGLLGSAWTFR